MNRLSKYILILLTFFITLELFFRHNYQEILILSDKQLIKSAILKKLGLQNVAVFGSSRSNDAFDSRYFSKQVVESNPLIFKRQTSDVKNPNSNILAKNKDRISFQSFNAASIRMSPQKYLQSLNEAFKNQAANLFIIEISEGIFSQSDSKATILTSKQAKSADEISINHDQGLKIEGETGIEGFLQDFFYDNFILVQQRHALKLKTALRLLMLKSAGYIPSERWFRSGIIKSFFAKDIVFMEEDYKKYSPQIYQKSSEHTVYVQPDHEVFKNELMHLFKNINNKYILINLPVKIKVREQECTSKNREFYKYMVYQLDTTVLDFSCLDLPNDFFKDEKHLNYRGRVFFSKLLAHHLTSMDLIKNAF